MHTQLLLERREFLQHTLSLLQIIHQYSLVRLTPNSDFTFKLPRPYVEALGIGKSIILHPCFGLNIKGPQNLR